MKDVTQASWAADRLTTLQRGIIINDMVPLAVDAALARMTFATDDAREAALLACEQLAELVMPDGNIKPAPPPRDLGQWLPIESAPLDGTYVYLTGDIYSHQWAVYIGRYVKHRLGHEGWKQDNEFDVVEPKRWLSILD